MPSNRTDMFLAAKRLIRVHRDWDDEQVAEYLGLRGPDVADIIGPARTEIEQDEGPAGGT